MPASSVESPTGNDSPYAQAAPALQALGYTCIPLIPRQQIPGTRRGGQWRFMFEWQQYADRAPTVFETNAWSSWAEGNIGMVMGTPAGPNLKVISFDIDTRDQDEIDMLRGACPQTPMAKVGSKGITLFFKAPPEIRSRAYRRHDKSGLADLLTGNKVKQTVVPPSIHPNGPVYRWVAGPVRPEDLPLFDETCLARLEDTLEHLGWNGKIIEEERAARRQADRLDDDPSIWQELNDEAMANLGKWVEALNLYGLKEVRRGGYEAVATWRDSSDGQPLEKRKANLKIHPSGIRDMGVDVGYTPLDLVCAANNWTLDDAFSWLKERVMEPEAPVFVMPSPAAVEAAFRDAAAASPPPAPEEPEAEDDGEAPGHLLKVPGLVGQLADFITDSAIQPIPLHSLGAALCIIGTAAGRKFCTPTRSGTHLYVLALAPSGTGKNHPLAACVDILQDAGMSREMGPSQFMSYSSVVARMARHPLMLCAVDEFGNWLAKVNGAGSSSHEKGISGILRTAWGYSFRTFMTPEKVETPSIAISAPAISIYGASTHKEFYKALTSEDTSNGMLNRILVLSTARRDGKRKPLVDLKEYPPALLAQIKAIHGYGGGLANMTAHNGTADAPPKWATWGPGAEKMYDAFDRRMTRRVDRDEWYARAPEYAVRLATIVAIGLDYDNPVVTSDLMAWGIAFSEWSFDRLVAEADEFMAGSEFEELCNDILRFVKAEKVVSRSQIVGKIRRVDRTVLNRALETLVEGGRLETFKDPEPTGTKVADLYRLPGKRRG